MRRVGSQQVSRSGTPVAPPPAKQKHGPDEAALRIERESIKVILQRPELAAGAWPDLGAELFTDDGYRICREVVDRAGGPKDVDDGGAFVRRVLDSAPDDAVRGLLTGLAVEPLQHLGNSAERYAVAVLARLQEIGVTRRIQELKGRLQRLNPEQADDYNRLFGDLIALEARKQKLREQAIGEL
jgi:DNA primase